MKQKHFDMEDQDISEVGWKTVQNWLSLRSGNTPVIGPLLVAKAGKGDRRAAELEESR